MERRMMGLAIVAALQVSPLVMAESLDMPEMKLPASHRLLVVSPTDPPSMSVRIGSTTLAFDPPEVRDWQTDAIAPRSHASWYEPWQPWPRKGKDGKLNTIELGPRHDGGAPILGALFRSVLAESVVVTSADGSKTFVMGSDYAYNPEWGQIANLEDRLGVMGEAKLKVKCRFATQRIDLIQRGAEGATPSSAAPPRSCAQACRNRMKAAWPWRACMSPHGDRTASS